MQHSSIIKIATAVIFVACFPLFANSTEDSASHQHALRYLEVVGFERYVAYEDERFAFGVNPKQRKLPCTNNAYKEYINQSLFKKFTPTMLRLKPTLAKLYSEIFSEDELKQLIAFYSSELGTKITTNTTPPDITIDLVTVESDLSLSEHELSQLNNFRNSVTGKKVQNLAPDLDQFLFQFYTASLVIMEREAISEANAKFVQEDGSCLEQ